MRIFINRSIDSGKIAKNNAVICNLNLKSNKRRYQKRELVPLLVLGVEMCLSVMLKYHIISNYATPFSDDGGIYIREAKIWLGIDLWKTGPKFPYLSTLPLSLLLIFLDELTTLKIALLTYSTFIAVPFYLLAKEITQSKFVPLITTSLILFYPMYARQLGYSNYAMFLGVSFICLSMYFLIRTFRYPSRSNILRSAFSISLIAGTDIIPFYYFILGLLFFAMANLPIGRHNFISTLRLLTKIALASFLFSIPYFPLYLWILSEIIGSPNVSEGSFNIYYIWSLFQSQVYYWQFWLVFIILSFLIFIYRGGKDKVILFIGSFLVMYLALHFLTPINYRSTRPSYYLMLMNFLFLSLFLKTTFDFLRKRNLRVILKLGHREISSRMASFSKFILLAVLLLLAYVQIDFAYTSANVLRDTIESYYVLSDNYLEVLKWCKENTDSNAGILIVSRYYYLMQPWTEAIAERRAIDIAKAYPSGRQVGTLLSELEMSRIASSMLSGNYITYNENLRIVEVFPTLLLGTPKIAVNRGIYQDVIALNENSADIYITDTSNSTRLFNMNLIRPETRRFDKINESYSSVSYQVTYSWRYLNFSRTTRLEADSTVLHISYHIRSATLIKNVSIPVYTLTKAWISSSIKSDNLQKLSLILLDRFGTPLKANVTFAVSKGPIEKLETITVSDGTVYGIILLLQSNSSFVDFFLEISFDIPKAKTQSIKHFSSLDWMTKHNFKYVLVDVDSEWFYDFRDWLENSGYYYPIYRSGNILLYEFKVMGS